MSVGFEAKRVGASVWCCRSNNFHLSTLAYSAAASALIADSSQEVVRINLPGLSLCRFTQHMATILNAQLQGALRCQGSNAFICSFHCQWGASVPAAPFGLGRLAPPPLGRPQGHSGSAWELGATEGRPPHSPFSDSPVGAISSSSPVGPTILKMEHGFRNTTHQS